MPKTEAKSTGFKNTAGGIADILGALGGENGIGDDIAAIIGSSKGNNYQSGYNGLNGNDNETNSSGLGTGAIIGIVAAVGLLLYLAIKN